MATKNNPGDYDCYAHAAPDEPMFVLLARDPSAPVLVELWAKIRDARGGADPAKVAEALACAESMKGWASEQDPLAAAVKAASVKSAVARVVAALLPEDLLR